MTCSRPYKQPGFRYNHNFLENVLYDLMESPHILTADFQLLHNITPLNTIVTESIYNTVLAMNPEITAYHRNQL